MPGGLENLVIRACKALTKLPDKLPKSLKVLQIYDCDNLIRLPEELPPELEILDVYREEFPINLADAEQLPNSLKTLRIGNGGPAWRIIKRLPDSLETLELLSNWGLQLLPELLPSGLKILGMYYCTKIESLPEVLPAGLTELTLNKCDRLKKLPTLLPKTLEILDLWACNSLSQEERARALCQLIEQDLYHGLTLLPHFELCDPQLQHKVGEKIAQKPLILLKSLKDFFDRNSDSPFFKPSLASLLGSLLLEEQCHSRDFCSSSCEGLTSISPHMREQRDDDTCFGRDASRAV